MQSPPTNRSSQNHKHQTLREQSPDMICKDCQKPIRFYQQRVNLGRDFIVHTRCLQRVDREWEETKKTLIKEGFDVDNCGWEERLLKPKE